MPNVFTGNVQGLSAIATGTPAAFCREVTGGTFSIDRHNIAKPGIGGQRHKRGGTVEATLDWTCLGPAKEDTALWFPTTNGVQVAAFPDFLVETDDGANGQEWVVSAGQPGTVSIALGDGEDAEVEYTFSAKFALVTPAAAGTAVPVYNSVKGHTHNDIGVTVVAATDEGVLSFALSNDLGLDIFNPATTKSPDTKAFPDGYVYSQQAVKLDLVTSQPLCSTILDDLLTDVEIAIAMANGTAGENITITGATMSPDTWSMPVSVGGKVGFATSYSPGDGTQYGQILFT